MIARKFRIKQQVTREIDVVVVVQPGTNEKLVRALAYDKAHNKPGYKWEITEVINSDMVDLEARN